MNSILSAASASALALALSAPASAQLYGGFSFGESYFEDVETGTVSSLLQFDLFEVFGAAANDADRILYLVGPNPASTSSGSLFAWDYNDPMGPTEIGPIVTDTGASYRWDALTYDSINGKLYLALAFPPFGAPGTARGIYELDPATLVATQVLSFSTVGATVSISGLGFNRNDGLIYAPDDVGLQIVAIDLNAQTVTPVAGSSYVSGSADVDGCTVGNNRVYLIDDDPTYAPQVFNLGTGTYEAPHGINASGATSTSAAAWLPRSLPTGTAYCSGVVNSTGVGGEIEADGSRFTLDRDMILRASSLPQNSFGFFLASQQQANTPNPGGSQGTLCLGGSIGRYVGPGQIKNSGAAGGFELEIDLGAVPTPTGSVAVMPGETWNFQAWHRDSVGGSAVSNFTGAVSVLFL